MKGYLQGLAEAVRTAIAGVPFADRRTPAGVSQGGDAQFGVDELAEEAVRRYVVEAGLDVVLSTEGRHDVRVGNLPEYLLVVDPIDGTRPYAAGFDQAVVSIAAARPTSSPRVADVEYALVLELNGGRSLYAHRGQGVQADGYAQLIPSLSDTTELSRLFWAMEFNGHPAKLMTEVMGALIDASANSGAVFVFSSSCYAITRVVTGQLDAYLDIGNRLLRDRPWTEPDFRRVGRGHVLHLFPYDIAAAALIAEEAGAAITDCYGKGLGETLLLDSGPLNQRSCLTASSRQLHGAILEALRW